MGAVPSHFRLDRDDPPGEDRNPTAGGAIEAGTIDDTAAAEAAAACVARAASRVTDRVPLLLSALSPLPRLLLSKRSE